MPDNYAGAVASKKYADQFDAKKPERPYLPPDLFRADGPGVCVGRSDGPTAPRHLDETGTNRITNSVFLVFAKLPGGRGATLDYVKQSAEFDKPLLLPDTDEESRRTNPVLLNPAVPQFPKGIEVALVRRAMLIDSSRRIRPTSSTESIQLRVMRTDPGALTPALLDELIDFSPADLRQAARHQAFFEFQLRRADLFAQEAGGLRGVFGERDFKTGFSSHRQVEFERPLGAVERFPELSQPVESNRASCTLCHALPGVYGLNTLRDFRAGIIRDADMLTPHPLAAMKIADVEKTAIQRKEKERSWKILADAPIR